METSFLHEPGDLARVPLAAVLIAALNERATGQLQVQHDGGSSRIYLRDGIPVGSQTFDGFQPLGQMLLARGRIDVGSLNDSLAGMAATGRPQGEILVAIGAVTRSEVDALLTEQQEAYLARIASLEAGTFRFDRSKPVPTWTTSLRLQPLKVIVQALEKPQAAALVMGALQPVAGGPLSLAPGYRELAHAFGWSGAEAQLVDRLASLTTLEEFFAEPGVAPERARAILAALLLLGLAQLGAAPGQTVDSVPGIVVDLADLAGVEVIAEPPPPARSRPTPAPGAVPPPASAPAQPAAPARRSDPEEARRRRQRLLQRAMQNMGIGPLSGRPAPPSARPPPAAAPVSAPTSPAPTAAERELRRGLEELRPRLLSANLFVRLGIEPEATREQVKQAYFALAKQFHPDRFLSPALADLGPEVKELFASLNEAYEALSDDARRAEHQARVARPGAGAAASPGQAAAAALDFQKGEACLRTRDFGRARSFLEAAVRANPTPEHLAALAQALAQDPRAPDRARARDLLAQALKSPASDRAAYVAGMLAREDGREEEAERLFRLALQANPRHVEAEREVRLIEMRRKRK